MRRPLALVLVVAPCSLLLACGGSDDPEQVIAATPAAVLAASQATLAVETASIEFSTTIDLSSLGLSGGAGPLELNGEGVIDFVGRQSQLELDFGAVVEQLGDEIPASMADSFDEPLQLIQDGTTSYVCGSLFRLLAGSECVSIDRTGEIGGNPVASMFIGGADPQALLQVLGGAGAVEEVGEEEVVGVSTTHLSGTFTVARALAELGADDAAALEAQFEAMGIGSEFADTEQRFDVWIDGDGLVRQVRQSIDVSAVPGAEDIAPVVSEFRYVDFDVSVDIEVPTDAVDITTFEGLSGG